MLLFFLSTILSYFYFGKVINFLMKINDIMQKVNLLICFVLSYLLFLNNAIYYMFHRMFKTKSYFKIH